MHGLGGSNTLTTRSGLLCELLGPYRVVQMINGEIFTPCDVKANGSCEGGNTQGWAGSLLL